MYGSLPRIQFTPSAQIKRFCNAAFRIAELVRVKKSWKLVENSLTTLF